MSYECTTCVEVFETSQERRHHVHVEHGPLPNVCSLCKEPFLTARSLEQHLADHNRPRPRGGYRRRKRKQVVQSSLLQLPVSSLCTSSTARDNFPLDKSALYSLTPESIDDFITSKVQPDSQFLKTCGKIVNRLVNFLQHNCSLQQSRVLKVGSLGKGTAVKGKADADVVVMLNKYTSVETMFDNIDGILSDIEKTIKADASFTFKLKTHRDVKVEVITSSGENISADILPAVDVARDMDSLDMVYEEMGKNKKIRGYYSPCLAPLQIELFADIPTKLKSLIRLLKYWKKEILVKEDKARTKWPSSYITELIVINAWEQAGEPVSFDMTRGLHAVLTSIVDHESFRVVFSAERRFYDRQFLPKQLPRTYIIDPCNPYNDVYNHPFWPWKKFADKAQEWLQQPLFQHVWNTQNKW